LDADDLAHPDKLHRELELFASFPDLDLVFADLQKFTARPDETPGWLALDHFVPRAGAALSRKGDNVYLCTSGFYGFMSAEVTGINVQTAMIRQSALESEPYWFDENILVGEDADLFFRLARRCRMAFINEVLAYYRQRPESVSRDPVGRLESEIRVYADNLARAQTLLTGKVLAGCRRQVASRYRGLGYLYYVKGDMAPARRAYVAAVRLEPRLSAITDLLKTWVPPRLMTRMRGLRRAGRGLRMAHRQS
jgi:hypothetical protein